MCKNTVREMEIYLGISVILPTATGEITMHLHPTGKTYKGCCMVLNFRCSLKRRLFPLRFYVQLLHFFFCYCFVSETLAFLFFSECISVFCYQLRI